MPSLGERDLGEPGTASYQVVTNFWLTEPGLGYHPCERYASAVSLLEAGAEGVAGMASVLEATSQSSPEGGTIYSTIFDLGAKRIHIAVMGRFDEWYAIDCGEARTRRRRVRLDRLAREFPRASP